MIWLTWRQHRIEALIGIVLLAALSIVFIRDGITMYSLYRALNMAACLPQDPCSHAFSARTFGLASTITDYLQPWLALVIGVFIGAPLVAREREQRTHYLVWLQSTTRGHWLAVKLGLIAASTLLAFVALSLLTTWWGEPLSVTMGPWFLYDVRGFLLPAYALFGLMLGVAVGTFTRRTVLAMALTFVIFFVVFMVMNFAHPYLVPPLSRTFALSTNQNARWGGPTDLVLYAGYADRAGHETGEISTYCGFHRTLADPDYGTLADRCIKAQHLQWKVVYQPAERFWLLQAVEATILCVLAVLLVPLSFWRLRRQRN
jgi:ABC-type transport system involved in multi-copper enzyme maturation permease subunit